MDVELIFAPEAAQDLAEAYAWYESRRAGLGEEFLGCVDGCMAAICRTPELAALVFQDYRRALVRRFPYAVYYQHTTGRLVVYAIFHTSRDPKKWRERLE